MCLSQVSDSPTTEARVKTRGTTFIHATFNKESAVLSSPYHCLCRLLWDLRDEIWLVDMDSNDLQITANAFGNQSDNDALCTPLTKFIHNKILHTHFNVWRVYHSAFCFSGPYCCICSLRICCHVLPSWEQAFQPCARWDLWMYKRRQRISIFFWTGEVD